MTHRRTVGTVTYDAGALIAAENGQRRMLSLHAEGLQRLVQPVVPAVVVAQVWRGGPQAGLSRVLDACVIEPLGERAAREAGRLLGRAGRHDVVDAIVVLSAAARGDDVITSDVDDLSALAKTLGVRLRLLAV